ncbi:MAG: xanthine dehydrogenase family protein molybdopterin-binding subunit [bacterium]
MAADENKDYKTVGQPVRKVDGISLATGNAKFVDDHEISNKLHLKMLRSPHAHARIKDIDSSAAEAMEGVEAVLTWEDLPRVPLTTAGQGFPEPSPYDTFVLDNKVRYVGDRVAAVAAESEDIAEEAIRKIEVDYEVLDPVLDPEKAMDEDAPTIHDEEEAHAIIPIEFEPEKNMASHVDFEVGDIEKELENSDVVVDKRYEPQYAQHCPAEPHTATTYKDENDRLVILTSTQVPFHVRRLVAKRLEMPVKDIRVIKPRIGGGFGTKQEVLIEDICAAMTLETGRPVSYTFTRQEEFASSRTRHPQIVDIKVGANRDGELKAISLDILMNTGAYGSHALTVVCNSGSKVLPLYNKVDAVEFIGNVVYTNKPVGGAYRGYGATQSYFAMEAAIDEIARELDMDPVELREKNHIKSGETSPVFQALGEGKEGVEQVIDSCGLEECIEQGAEEFGWEDREERREESTGSKKRGFGMCTLMQGSAIPEIDMGAASLKMNEDGSFNLLMGATDLGTGSDTVLSQVAAETLEVPVEDIIPYSSDTDMTPFDVGAYASSTTYLSGMAVKKTAQKVKKQILEAGAEMLDSSPTEVYLEDKQVFDPDGNSVTFEDVALYTLYENNQHQIAAHDSHITHKSPPPFSAHFVEVEVDTETGKVEVVQYVNATDCGTALHPRLAEGQCEGATVNGISYALTEEFKFNEKGKLMNPSFDSYSVYKTSDMPELKTILVPTHEDSGPYGAKSVSEIGINGPLPAISNAIYDAVGVRMQQAPFSSERVLQKLEKKE